MSNIVVFAILREISSELYYRSTPHHDAVREKNILDRQVIGSFSMHWPDFFSSGCPRG